VACAINAWLALPNAPEDTAFLFDLVIHETNRLLSRVHAPIHVSSVGMSVHCVDAIRVAASPVTALSESRNDYPRITTPWPTPVLAEAVERMESARAR
jgi:hypothetical protein